MTFYSYMMSQTTRDDAIGDLARDMSIDCEFPRKSQSFKKWVAHLVHKDASQRALEALSDAFDAYHSTLAYSTKDREDLLEADISDNQIQK